MGEEQRHIHSEQLSATHLSHQILFQLPPELSQSAKEQCAGHLRDASQKRSVFAGEGTAVSSVASSHPSLGPP